MSRGHRLLAVLFFSMILPVFVSAESTEVLATGPDRGRGLPYLSPNVIVYYRVSYRPAVAAGRGDAISQPMIGVLYTDTPLVAPSSWRPAPCGTTGVMNVAAEEVYYYPDPRGWSLLFRFPSGYASSCSFIAAFLDRFDYFLGITGDNALSSFPARVTVP